MDAEGLLEADALPGTWEITLAPLKTDPPRLGLKGDRMAGSAR